MKNETPSSPCFETNDASAVFDVTINQFRPIGSVFGIEASLELTKMAPCGWCSCEHDAIKLLQPLQATLIFRLTNPNYCLLSIAFAGSVPLGKNKIEEDPSIQAFPKLTTIRGATQAGAASPEEYYSCLMLEGVTPDQKSKHVYDFIIIVQDVKTGELGIIDPQIENDF